jgi:hypothetical protein
LPCLIRILLIFQHEHCGNNFNFIYAQVFQNITIPISEIPEYQFDISNSDMMSPSCDLSLFKFEDLLISVAVLKSQISNKLFFFWPEMKRADIKIYPNDMFCHENFVHHSNSKKTTEKEKAYYSKYLYVSLILKKNYCIYYRKLIVPLKITYHHYEEEITELS